MKCPAIQANEKERLIALGAYGLEDGQPLPSLDPVVHIAARMSGMPVAAVNMIGTDHVFFAASTGVGEVDMRRDVSFCAHAINYPDGMVIPDTMLDERFHDNPLVPGAAGVRFYAGVPLLSPDGLALGALCILDRQPHPEFSEEEWQRLRELARMASDRLELRRIAVSAERTRPKFDEYASGSLTPVIWFDEDGGIVAWNDAAAAVYGYTQAEGIGCAVDSLLAEDERPAFRALIVQAVEAGSLDRLDVPAELNGLCRNGQVLRLGFSLFCWRDAGRLMFEAVLRDQTAQRRERDELRQQACFDALTGLANRSRFYRCVEAVLTRAEPAVVLMIDLDGFKDINDTLGHALGDSILREVAVRLSHMAGPADTVARIGGDEFAVLLTGISDPDAASQAADTVIGIIGRTMVIDGHEIRVSASCGVALAPLHAMEALELVGNADLALFKAKSIDRGRRSLFEPALRMEAVARRRHGLELHRAVDNGEFLLFYQPQVSLVDGAITGAEALIRWLHPERGLLTPAAFLPSLESGPLAATVGAWVLDAACAQAAFWRRHGAPTLRMGVNLFGAQFRIGGLAADVIGALERHGLPPDALELEVTENIALAHDDVALATLECLRAQGVGIAFDDFGTGYASLSLLKTYPLTRIKIDRSFVQGMLESRRDASVVCAILDMARSFELQTIAEGIETDAQRQRLRLERCDEGQGYLFGKPLPAAQFELLLGIGRGAKVAA